MHTHHHVDYFLFGAAIAAQQLQAFMSSLGTAASVILAAAAILRAVTEMVRVCKLNPRPNDAISPTSLRSFCPLARFCRVRQPKHGRCKAQQDHHHGE